MFLNGTKLTDLYLPQEVDPNVKNNDGFTPLCLAAMNPEEKCVDVAQDLIRKGAKVCKKCKGKFPIELAVNQVTIDVSSLSKSRNGRLV